MKPLVKSKVSACKGWILKSPTPFGSIKVELASFSQCPLCRWAGGASIRRGWLVIKGDQGQCTECKTVFKQIAPNVYEKVKEPNRVGSHEELAGNNGGNISPTV